MWYDGGSYLLNYYKSKNQKAPLYWLKDSDLIGIENQSNYNELIKRSKYIEKLILRK